MEEITLIYGNQIEKMVPRLINETGALKGLRPSHRVVIKPNLLVSRRDWKGVNTETRVVEGVVEALKERGVSHITIGDGSGMGYSATKAFEICGYRDLEKRYGFRLVDLERDRFAKKAVTIDGPFEELDIARTVLDCDFLINMPLMKAHNETLVTCSLKNLKGVMPRSMKTAFHGVDLSRAISQLNSALVPDLIIVDGIQGNLTSESSRDPVAMDRILLGSNPVAIDSVVADMLGYAPRAIRHIAYSADGGLGPCDLEKIKIRPLNRPSKEERYDPPIHYSKRFPCRIIAEGACCTCMGNLIFAMERLKEQGLLSQSQTFLVGQGVRMPPNDRGEAVAVGECAVKQVDAGIRINRCPPSAGIIYRMAAAAIQKGH